MSQSRHRVHGAYVAAWVYVELPTGHEAYQDHELRRLARQQYGRDGEIEIDEDAEISRNEEDWCEECCPGCGYPLSAVPVFHEEGCPAMEA
jgi:hypothetical protein